MTAKIYAMTCGFLTGPFGYLRFTPGPGVGGGTGRLRPVIACQPAANAAIGMPDGSMPRALIGRLGAGLSIRWRSE